MIIFHHPRVDARNAENPQSTWKRSIGTKTHIDRCLIYLSMHSESNRRVHRARSSVFYRTTWHMVPLWMHVSWARKKNPILFFDIPAVTRIIVDTVFLTRIKEGDFCEKKVADLKETKRYTVLESADGVRPMDQRNMPWRCWSAGSGIRAIEKLPMKSRNEKRIRTLRKS